MIIRLIFLLLPTLTLGQAVRFPKGGISGSAGLFVNNETLNMVLGSVGLGGEWTFLDYQNRFPLQLRGGGYYFINVVDERDASVVSMELCLGFHNRHLGVFLGKGLNYFNGSIFYKRTLWLSSTALRLRLLPSKRRMFIEFYANSLRYPHYVGVGSGSKLQNTGFGIGTGVSFGFFLN